MVQQLDAAASTREAVNLNVAVYNTWGTRQHCLPCWQDRAQHAIAEHSAGKAEHSTAQHSTAQHSTAQLLSVCSVSPALHELHGNCIWLLIHRSYVFAEHRNLTSFVNLSANQSNSNLFTKMGKWHAGELDRQQLWQRNQDRPATASRQHSIDSVRLEELDIYIVSHSLAHLAVLNLHVLQTGRLLL